MYTILQDGEQGNPFYTLQVNGVTVEHFTTLEAAAGALERLKQSVKAPAAQIGSLMTRWYKGEYNG